MSITILNFDRREQLIASSAAAAALSPPPGASHYTDGPASFFLPEHGNKHGVLFPCMVLYPLFSFVSVSELMEHVKVRIISGYGGVCGLVSGRRGSQVHTSHDGMMNLPRLVETSLMWEGSRFLVPR